MTDADQEALMMAAEHGVSTMTTSRTGDPPYHLYHRCDGCEAAIRFLQSKGRCLNVSLDTTEAESP